MSKPHRELKTMSLMLYVSTHGKSKPIKSGNESARIKDAAATREMGYLIVMQLASPAGSYNNKDLLCCGCPGTMPIFFYLFNRSANEQTDYLMVFSKVKQPIKVYELDERDDGTAIQENLAAITGFRTVPQVFINGNCVGGGTDVKALHASGKLEPMLIG
ncbi:unnamed protein product [Spodoptera exigua]|nr:unnamed protein product [Spodoptera exigua]